MENQTRVDILIQDVRALEIRMWFDGIVIAEEASEYLGQFQSNPLELLEPGNKIYALRSKAWRGFVLAGIISTLEDDAEFMEPSGLLPKNRLPELGRT